MHRWNDFSTSKACTATYELQKKLGLVRSFSLSNLGSLTKILEVSLVAAKLIPLPIKFSKTLFPIDFNSAQQNYQNVTLKKSFIRQFEPPKVHLRPSSTHEHPLEPLLATKQYSYSYTPKLGDLIAVFGGLWVGDMALKTPFFVVFESHIADGNHAEYGYKGETTVLALGGA